MRIEEDLDIPLGAVLKHATRGNNYVYIGFTVNSKGMVHHFMPARTPLKPDWFEATFSMTSTALKHFPQLVEYRKVAHPGP